MLPPKYPISSMNYIPRSNAIWSSCTINNSCMHNAYTKAYFIDAILTLLYYAYAQYCIEFYNVLHV